MHIQTQGMLLAVTAYGENGVLLTLFTPDKGKIKGFSRRSRKQDGLLQPGNLLYIDWKRRLENQLGNLTFEPHLNMAARCFGDETRLLLLHYLAEVLYHALPDEEPHANLYDQLVVFLEAFPQPDLWQRLAFFELKLLLVLGYGLSLSHENAVPCPQGAPLKYVSPKSGRAVSAAVGQPYADKLLRLPALFGGEQCAEDKDFLDVFRLTGHFLEKALHGKSLHTRDALLDKGRATDFVTGKNASQ